MGPKKLKKSPQNGKICIWTIKIFFLRKNILNRIKMAENGKQRSISEKTSDHFRHQFWNSILEIVNFALVTKNENGLHHFEMGCWANIRATNLPKFENISKILFLKHLCTCPNFGHDYHFLRFLTGKAPSRSSKFFKNEFFKSDPLNRRFTRRHIMCT